MARRRKLILAEAQLNRYLAAETLIRQSDQLRVARSVGRATDTLAAGVRWAEHEYVAATRRVQTFAPGGTRY